MIQCQISGQDDRHETDSRSEIYGPSAHTVCIYYCVYEYIYIFHIDSWRRWKKLGPKNYNNDDSNLATLSIAWMHGGGALLRPPVVTAINPSSGDFSKWVAIFGAKTTYYCCTLCSFNKFKPQEDPTYYIILRVLGRTCCCAYDISTSREPACSYNSDNKTYTHPRGDY